MYELRTLLNTGMCLDIAGGSTTKGANIQLYTANGTNAQKFVLADESDGWSLQNPVSQMYVDVAGGAAANRTNVQQYTDNDTRAQRWTVTDTGETVTIDGVSCAVATLQSNVAASPAYMMDVTSALTTDKTNIWIYTSNGSDAQKWALLPTALLDSSLAAPSILGWVEAVGDTDAQQTRFGAATLYPVWAFPVSWEPGTAAFEYRYRTREVSAQGTGEWSAFNAWAAASAYTSGQTAWLTSGIPATVTEKTLDVQLQVRTVTGSGLTASHSVSATANLRAAYAPSIEVTAATVSFNALRLSISSDYTDGTNSLFVQAVEVGGENILRTPYGLAGLGATGTGEIPNAALLQPVRPGDSVTVRYSYGTDQHAGTAVQADTVTVQAAAGYGLDVTPAIAESGGRALSVTVPQVGTVRVWTVCDSGMIPAFEGEGGTWTAVYPFGKPFSIYVSGLSSDGTQWGDSVTEYEADEFGKGCHAWNWANGAFLLQIVDGFMSTERSVKAQGDAMSLNSRDWETMQYSDTLSASFDAAGVIDRPIAESDKADLLALARAHHVIYRAPTGEIINAGIDGYSYSSTVLRTDVSVQMTQESI